LDEYCDVGGEVDTTFGGGTTSGFIRRAGAIFTEVGQRTETPILGEVLLEQNNQELLISIPPSDQITLGHRSYRIN
jgi:hypothetical protein